MFDRYMPSLGIEVLKDCSTICALAVCWLLACLIALVMALSCAVADIREKSKRRLTTVALALLAGWSIVNGTVTNASKSTEGEQDSAGNENGLLLNGSLGALALTRDSVLTDVGESEEQSNHFAFASFAATDSGVSFDIAWRGAHERWIDLYVTPRLDRYPWEYLDTVLTFHDYTTDGDVTVTHGEVDFSDNANLTNDYSSACFLAAAWVRDTDDDWLLDGDELYVYATDPENADTDYDGICDGEEVDYGIDPKNPHTLSELYCDGVAMKLGRLIRTPI